MNAAIGERVVITNQGELLAQVTDVTQGGVAVRVLEGELEGQVIVCNPDNLAPLAPVDKPVPRGGKKHADDH